MIGSPSYSGQIDVWYTNSLCNTIKAGIERDVDITPIWISFDALLQRARNDTIHTMLQGGFDELVWIDSDIEWQPDDFFKLLDYPVDVVGGTYRKKGDVEEYVVRQLVRKPADPATGLLAVDGLGTGFVRMSRSACQYLWDISRAYIDPKDNIERRWIFDVVIEDLNGVAGMVSEDIHAFNKLSAGGFGIWLDPSITCNHTGPYKFKGDFSEWYKKPLNSPRSPGLPALQRKIIPKTARQL
jgi:hypothetical protein